jgi:hypothetical protein
MRILVGGYIVSLVVFLLLILLLQGASHRYYFDIKDIIYITIVVLSGLLLTFYLRQPRNNIFMKYILVALLIGISIILIEILASLLSDINPVIFLVVLVTAYLLYTIIIIYLIISGKFIPNRRK